MKILFINGEDDYHFLTYEQQSEFSDSDIIKLCEENGGKYRFETTGGDHFDATIYEFNEVDLKFIEFVRHSIQDYDDSKHSNFVVIN